MLQIFQMRLSWRMVAISFYSCMKTAIRIGFVTLWGPCLAIACWVMLSLSPTAWAQDGVKSSDSCKSTGFSVSHRFQVSMRSRGLTLSASANMRWASDPEGAYQMQYTVKSMLTPEQQQTSKGRISDNSVLPEQFSEKGRKVQTLTVDRQRGVVRLPEAAQEIPLQSGTVDKLSVWAQLGLWAQCSPNVFKPQQTLAIDVWGAGETEHWTVQTVGMESIATPDGPRLALHLVRPSNQGGDTRFDVWYVPAWGPLPAQMWAQQSNGDRVEQQLLQRQPEP